MDAIQLYGMVLVTGPTGSGKTTTLTGASKINIDVNIMTAEDPVEYNLFESIRCSCVPRSA
jgi:type IV pilus assembly protein PilB